MKKIILLISILVTGYINANNAQGQAITDTLQWLKTNIEQKSSYYTGKPLSVLLDTLNKRNIYPGLWQYVHAFKSDGAQAESIAGDTVYVASFTIYFGYQLFGRGTVDQVHRANPSINTHLKWMYLKFTQKIPLPSNIIFDSHFGDQFNAVQSICRPFIVKSVSVGED